MSNSDNYGKLICMAGIDGAGKSSIVREFACKDASPIIPIEFYEKLRFVNQLDHIGDAPEDVANCLWLCEFMVSFGQRVLPHLRSGRSVIADRSPVCAKVYSEATLNSDISSLFYIYDEIVRPDLIVYLDIVPSEAVKRIELRGGEPAPYETRSGLTRLRECYMAILEKYDRPFVVVDAMRSQREVLDEVFALVQKEL